MARRGSSGWRLEVTGTPGHSSRVFSEEYGSGAIFEAARILNAFHETVRGPEYLTFNAGVILGGTQVDYEPAVSRGTAFGKTNVIPELGRNPHGYDRWSAELFTGKGTQDLSLDELQDTEYYNLMLARQYGYNVNGVHNMGSGGIELSMQAIIDAENLPVKYVPELSRAQALDHNIDWVQENYDFYKEHEDVLKDKVRFGVSLGSAMRQRDANILGYEDVIELQYGWEGVERMAPLKSLIDNDIPFHIEGTDPRNKPMKIVKDAVMRIDRKGRVVAADEAITREQAILAITRWGARFMSAEDELGTIEPGKWADLVVFDGDILEVPIEEIDQVGTVLTLVGGRVAYEAQ